MKFYSNPLENSTFQMFSIEQNKTKISISVLAVVIYVYEEE